MNTDYIISLEIYINMFTVHIITQKFLGNTYTYRTGTIKSRTVQNQLFKWIMNNDFENLINYFKKEYDLLHTSITFSYGPQLRKMLRERTQHNKEV